MTAYTIQINEYQRCLLVKALSHVNVELFAKEIYAANPLGADTPVEELTMLERMLKELPKEEADMQSLGHAPGQSVHGFCL